MSEIRWKPTADEHDYPAARDFLELVLPEERAASLAEAFRVAPVTMKKSKDILRASGLPSLGDDNPHVGKDLHRIRNGVALSPVLLVTGDALRGRPLLIADGYHRVCAVHLVDEDAEIHCHIVDLA